ncbi:MAG: nitrous oxide reductase accessory protein NosL [Chitinophagales bacterium]
MPVAYGEDVCAFCKMTIMDKRFSCQLQTHKGKTYKFDDLFCLLQFSVFEIIDTSDIAQVYVSDFSTGTFIESTQAQFLFNPAFRTPMEGNIAAFATMEVLHSVHSEKGGEIINWQEVLRKIEL